KCSIIPNKVTEKIVTISIPLVEGTFSQQLHLKGASFLSFEEGKNYYGGFVEAGDNIAIDYDALALKTTLAFAGRGSEKLFLSEAINSLRSTVSAEIDRVKSATFPIDYLFNKIDSMQNKLMMQLASLRNSMSSESFKLLSAYIKANVLRTKYNGIINTFGDSFENILKKHQRRLTPSSTKAIKDLLVFDNSLSHSYFYLSNVSTILSVYYDDNVKPDAGNGIKEKYAYLTKVLPANLQAPVIYLVLEKEIRQNKNEAIEVLIDQLFRRSQDSTYKRLLVQKLVDARALKVGSAAPSFSLENMKGDKVSLASFDEKVIYLDFWFAACVPCHKLFNDIRPVKEFFKSDSNVVFLTVSVDDRDTWEKALAKFKIGGYHAFTENKYRDHSIIREYNVSEFPTTYLIDKKGKIFSIDPSKDAAQLQKQIETALKQ
ncbi:MAG: TlpA family protein disulfide reductase, partial [Chitinophagaceae bacterium]